MAKGTEVGNAYVTVIPSVKNAEKEVASAIEPGAKKAGESAGESISKGITGKISGMKAAAVVALGNVMANAATKAAEAVGNIFSSTFTNFANYEQLIGGVQKLFGAGGMEADAYAQSVGKSVDEVAADYARLQSAQETVMANAAQAYKTAGMSANEYMEQATGFSASLINSLGGDTVKAAELADVAMRSMSDNVNTFGSDMESVSFAFSGFAKQNYTMLDNLKLGYGGTKTEMERLIKDANEYAAANGKAADLSIESFGDIITAIDLIQQKQGIAGTTAREAADTIEGSITTTKAAIDNLLTGLMDEDADIDALFDAVLESFDNVVKNVSPKVALLGARIIQALPGALAGFGPTVSHIIGEALQAAFGDSAAPVVQFVENLGANLDKIVPLVLGLAGGFKAVSAAAKAATAIKSVGTSVASIASRGASAASGLTATAVAERAAGSAGQASAKQIAAAALAVVALGAGVLLASTGIYMLVQGAIQIAEAGPLAAVALGGLTLVVAGFAAGAALLGPALTAGAVGLVAFGAAALMVGAGVLLASVGITMVTNALPILAAYGLQAAGAAMALAGRLTLFGVGALLAGAGALVLGAGLVVAGAGLVVVAAGSTAAAVGVGLLGAAVTVLGGGITLVALGFSQFAEALPIIAENGPGAAAALMELSGASVASSVGLLAAAPGLTALGAGALAAVGGVLGLQAGVLLLNATLLIVVAESLAAKAALAAMASGFSSSSSQARSFSSSVNSSMAQARATVVSGMEAIKSALSKPLKMGKIDVGPLPHFRFEGEFDAETKKVPSLSVDWYASGAIFSSPQIIGVGDARYPEVVSPLNKLPALMEQSGFSGSSDMAPLIQWLSMNLGKIIESSAPVATPRELRRINRKVEAYA